MKSQEADQGEKQGGEAVQLNEVWILTRKCEESANIWWRHVHIFHRYVCQSCKNTYCFLFMSAPPITTVVLVLARTATLLPPTPTLGTCSSSLYADSHRMLNQKYQMAPVKTSKWLPCTGLFWMSSVQQGLQICFTGRRVQAIRANGSELGLFWPVCRSRRVHALQCQQGLVNCGPAAL